MNDNNNRPMKPTRSSLCLASLAALALLLLTSAYSPCGAATHTWTGAAGDGKWSTAFNWANNSPPLAGEPATVILQFPAAGAKNSTNDLANLTLDQVQISGDNYVIAATAAGANVTLRSQTGFSSTFFISGANAVLTNFNFTLATTVVPSGSISVGAGDTATFRCQFTGPGGLIKRATGTLILDGNAPNTYTGLTDVQGGTVRLSQNGVAIPGDLIVGYPTLTNLAAVELQGPNQVGDNARIVLNDNGTFAPGVYSDTVGSITLSNANLVAGVGLTLQGDFTSIGTNVLTGTVRLGGADRFFRVTGQLTADAFIENSTGTAGIIKAGPGLMELHRGNTYNGITAVHEGTLMVSHASALGTAAVGTQVNPGASLQIKGSLAIAGETLFVTGTGVSSNGALCALDGNASWTGPVNLTGDAFIGVSDAAAQLSLSGIISGVSSLTKVGDGRLIFSGINANTFTGVTRVWGGTLRLAKSANLRAVRELEIGRTNLAGGICELGAANQIDDTAHVIVWHYGSFRLGGFDEALAGLTVVGSWVDTAGGLLTLLGDVEAVSWYEAGWLPGDGMTQSPGIQGRVSLGGATRTIHLSALSAAASPAIYLPCAFVDGAGTGGLRKTGPGWMFLDGTNTYSGPTLIDEGKVGISSPSALGGTAQGTLVADGAELLLGAGSLTIAEPLTLNGRGASGPLGPLGALQSMNGSNIWTGPISLATDTAIGVYNQPSLLTLAGGVSGPGQLTKLGGETLSFAGAAPNLFTGGLNVEAGTVRLSKPVGVTAVRNLIRVGTTNGPAGAARLVWGGAHQVQDGAAIFVESSGLLDVSIYWDEVGPLTMRGGILQGISGVLTLGGTLRAEKSASVDPLITCILSLGGAMRTFDIVDTTLTLTRDVQDGGAPSGILKLGHGKLVLDGAPTTYSGLTEARQGDVELRGAAKLGNTAAGTVIYSGARLRLTDAQIGDEPLTFDYDPGFLLTPDLTCQGTNSWQGPVTLRHQINLRTHFVQDRLTLLGAIEGDFNGALAKEGAGTLRIAGTNDNTFTGKTIAAEGVLELAKTNALAIPGQLFVGLTNDPWPKATVRLLNPHQMADTQLVTVHHSGLLDLNGFTDLVGGLELNQGEVRTGAGQLRLGGDVELTQVSTISGRLSLGDDSRVFHLAQGAVLNLMASVSALEPSAGFIQTGSGSVYLGGTNTFGGEMQILGGDLLAETPFAFGSAASGTVVSNYARINLAHGVWVTNEPLRLASGQLVGSYPSTNAWHGSITIGDYSVVETLGTNSLFYLGGAISGEGRLSLYGNFILHGSQPNTFTGELWTREGLVQLSKTNAVAVPSALTVGDSSDEEVSVVRLLRPGQIADSSAVSVSRQYSYMWGNGAPFVLDLNGFAETIGSLTGKGNVLLGPGQLTVGANNLSTDFEGTIAGSGVTNLVKLGSGALTLSGTNQYNGLTRVAGGTLFVNGSIVPSPVQVDAAGTLGGRGLTGDVVCNGGRLTPGPNSASPSCGRLKTGTFSFNSGSAFRCELGGPVAGASFDQVELDGMLNIANTILSVQPFGQGAVGNEYTVVRIASGAPAFGSFAGLPEGTVFTPTPGRTYRITYHGGAGGRDVVLTQLAAPQPAQMSGIQPTAAGQMQVMGLGTAGLGYDVYAATTIETTNWVNLGSITADASGVLQFIDVDAANFPMRFYRFALP